MKSLKQFSIKTISVILSLLMVVSILPMNVFAQDIIEISNMDDKSTSTSAIQTRDIFEVITLREENVKHFKLMDGTYVAVVYDYPVHRLDNNNQWEDIDNTLFADGSEYSTSYARVKFVKKTTGNESLFTLHENNRKLSMSLNGATKKTIGTITNDLFEDDENAT